MKHLRVVLSLFMIIIILLSFCACAESGKAVDDGKYYVDYTVDKILYETEDGTWTNDNVHEMIDRYYNEKRSDVHLTIYLMFTAKESFHYASYTCKGGIGEIDGNGFLYQVFTETMGQNDPDGELYEAGTYQLIIQDATVRFYASRGFLLPAFERGSVKLENLLEIIRYE